MIKKLKSPFHSNHAEHSADFICELVDEKRVLRKAIKAKDKTIERLVKIKDLKNSCIESLEDIEKQRNKTIEAQAKEIERATNVLNITGAMMNLMEIKDGCLVEFIKLRDALEEHKK